MVHSDRDSDNDGDGEVNSLVVPPLENASSQEEIVAKWVNQDVFMDADERENLENDDSEDEMQMDIQVEHPTIQEKTIEDSPKKNSRVQKRQMAYANKEGIVSYKEDYATSATTAMEREGKEDKDDRILNEIKELTNAIEEEKGKETSSKETS
ncbi:unnamed protein product [Fraxinus pennsylvanica]|uniref:Uncharacterized protein n=1 Tax=Fraxinus pennsylvanica TaxID=56036 RepID=A0AAD2A3J1_9LAMI|nr:unnamed protein product [Fraxinus pennsylvanica]